MSNPWQPKQHVGHGEGDWHSRSDQSQQHPWGKSRREWADEVLPVELGPPASFVCGDDDVTTAPDHSRKRSNGLHGVRSVLGDTDAVGGVKAPFLKGGARTLARTRWTLGSDARVVAAASTCPRGRRRTSAPRSVLGRRRHMSSSRGPHGPRDRGPQDSEDPNRMRDRPTRPTTAYASFAPSGLPSRSVIIPGPISLSLGIQGP